MRPRVVAGTAGMPAVGIAVDRNRVPVGDEITVTLSPAFVVTNPRYNIALNFGDGVRITTHQTEIVHQYQWPGFYTLTVSVGPAKAVPDPTPKPGSVVPPGVSLSVSSTNPIVGREVDLSAKLTYPDPGIKYRFIFGDSSNPTEWQSSPKTSHAYSAAGSYWAHVDIGQTNNGFTKKIGSSESLQLEVAPASLPLPGVTLTADPAQLEEGHSVLFTARLSSSNPNIRYRFTFGDGSSSLGWQSGAQAKHRFAVAADYAAYVEITLVSNAGFAPRASSKSVRITVTPRSQPSPTPTPVVITTAVVTPTSTPGDSPTPTPGGTASPAPDASITPTPADSGVTATPGIATTSPGAGASPSQTGSRGSSLFGLPPDWWKYILIALIVILVAYQAFRLLFIPRFTLQTHRDPGVAAVEVAGAPLSIDFQIDLDPNVGDGEYGVDTNEPGFIKSERSGNG